MAWNGQRLGAIAGLAVTGLAVTGLAVTGLLPLSIRVLRLRRIAGAGMAAHVALPERWCQTPIGCQTLLVSTNAPMRAMPGAAVQSSARGLSTRLTFSAAATCSGARSAVGDAGEVQAVHVAVRGQPRREFAQ